jgi:hypothetical protein
MPPKTLQVLIAWGGALLGAALLRWAGRHDLMPSRHPAVVLSFVLVPVLITGAAVLVRTAGRPAASDNPQD